jgi:hypothetical protein
MMQPAEPRVRQDATGGYGANSLGWRSLPKSKMRAVFVVIANVFREQSFQMAFVHGNDVIKQVSSAALDPTLRDAILPGTLEGGPHRTYLQGSNRYGNIESILPVPVEDQKPGSQPKGKRFPQLLDRPQARWMFRDVEVQNPSSVVGNDEEAMEHAEGDRRNREEVHCGDRFPMITQKGEPTLRWLRISRRSFHPAGDRSLRDIKTQHEQLAMDARRSPGRILGHDSEDQLANFLRSLPSSNLPPDLRDQPPIRLKTVPVPTDHCFRRDHNERLLPLGPKPTDRDPEELVQDTEYGPRAAPLQHGELLPEHEVLEDEIPAATEKTEEGSEPEQGNVEHSRSYNRTVVRRWELCYLFYSRSEFWRTTGISDE